MGAMDRKSTVYMSTIFRLPDVMKNYHGDLLELHDTLIKLYTHEYEVQLPTSGNTCPRCLI